VPDACEGELHRQCDLLRDIFNPFSPAAVDPALLVSHSCLVMKCAQAAYEERELPSGILFQTRITALADALEEAGYTDEAILSHLRGPGPHVRGCWALDLVLGRS